MEQEKWVFSFGHGHKYGPNSFIVIEGDVHTSREEMFRRYGDKWAFQYPIEKERELLAIGMVEVKE